MKITLPENLNGMRIDSVIPLLNEKISRSLAQSLIKEGKVLLDGKIVKTSTKVCTGQAIEIPDDYEKEIDESIVAENIPLDVIYEDNDIVVVNKPKNMVVHPAVGNYSGTLVNALLRKNKAFGC